VKLECDIDYALTLGEGRQRENSKMCSLLARVLAESKGADSGSGIDAQNLHRAPQNA